MHTHSHTPYLSALLPILLTSLLSALSATHPQEFSLTTVSPDYTTLTLAYNLPPQEAIFHDSIVLSTNSSALTVNSWHADRAPEPYFDQVSQSSRPAYQGAGTITITCIAHQKPTHALKLFVHYFSVHARTPQERTFTIPVTLSSLPEHAAESPTPTAPAPPLTCATESSNAPLPSLTTVLYEGAHTLLTSLKSLYQSGKLYISDLFTNSSSLPLQLLLAFILGILMSLTPCIYPMIPITVGLLGTSSSNSLLRNFVLAAAYTNGLALVCALLGLMATIFGAHCGQLICNPFILTPLILLLGYFGGSMLGWYELYIPRWLQPSSQSVKQGSLLAAFMLGIASGTVASPCMSPGLALLLSVVATLQNYFLGFLLLFIFGIGSSVPLLLIGTFSSSLHLLPRAGLWMNEIKKFFGFMLIMVCFYYAETLCGPLIAHGAAALFTLVYSGVYAVYMFTAKKLRSVLYSFCIMTLLIGLTLFNLYTAIIWYGAQQITAPHPTHWMYEYAAARTRALQGKKLLLIDFTASWCAYCVLVDKQMLSHADTQPLFNELVAVKIDGSDLSAEYQELTKQYKVPGIPLLLLVDPQTETVIRSWNSALLEKSPHQWVTEVRSLIHERLKLSEEFTTAPLPTHKS